MVGMVDHGERPAALASCGQPGSVLGDDPACWARCRSVVLPRANTRFAFFTTPESGTTAELRASCAAVSGLPIQVIDALEPSALPYFEPLAEELDAAQPGLASRVDLCQAFGSGAPAQLSAFASAWAQLLRAQP